MVQLGIVFILVTFLINKCAAYPQELLTWDLNDEENELDCGVCLCPDTFTINCDTKDTLEQIPSIKTPGSQWNLFQGM